MTVEHDPCACKEAEERDAGGELVDEEHVIGGSPWGEEVQNEMELAGVCKDDVKLSQDRAGKRGREMKDTELAVGGFVKRMGRVVVRGVDADDMASVLETESGINDEALSAACG